MGTGVEMAFRNKEWSSAMITVSARISINRFIFHSVSADCSSCQGFIIDKRHENAPVNDLLSIVTVDDDACVNVLPGT